MRAFALGVVLLFVSSAAQASPEPWSDDGPAPPNRLQLGAEYGVRAAAEYRASAIYARSIATTPNAQSLAYAEHRLRLDAALDWQERVKLVTSIDALDGVIWGDQEASTRASTTNPSVDRLCIVQGAGNPTQPSTYSVGTCSAEPFFVRRLYGEVRLPIGAIRIGRQAYDDGYGVLVADGDGRRNRFGLAYRGDNVDRIMFSTKPLELRRDGDPAEDRGILLHVAYDRISTGVPQRLEDDASEVVVAVRALAPTLGGLRDAEARLFYAHRWEKTPDLALNAVGGRVSYRLKDLTLGADAAMVLGSRAGKNVQQYGARVVAQLGLLRGLVGPYLELDYASDDFSFARDSNVGLLLFEQVLGTQSARAAAANASTLATGGAFHDATAVFPQLDLRPTEHLLLRAGALFAWAASPLNYAGGPASRAYGTELDARASYTFLEHFTIDVEAALLLPGGALADVENHAPHAGLVQSRGTFFF